MLTEAQREAYDRDGFIVVPDVFSPAEIDELRLVTDEFVASAARVTANDDIYDLEDSHTQGGAAGAPAEGAAPDPPGLFPRQPQRESRRDPHGSVGHGALRHRQAQHEIGRLRRAGRMAPGLGLLPAHQRRSRRGRHHARRCRHGERPDDGRAGQPQGPDPRPSRPERPVLRRDGPGDMRHRPVARAALSRQGRLDHRASRPRGARLGDELLGPRRAAFCCSSTAPPMPGRCSASRKASTSSTSSCSSASRALRRASRRCRCACRCRRPSTRARSTRTSAPAEGAISKRLPPPGSRRNNWSRQEVASPGARTSCRH